MLDLQENVKQALRESQSIRITQDLIQTMMDLKILNDKWTYDDFNNDSYLILKGLQEITHVKEIKKSYPIWTYDGLVDAMRSFRAKYSRSKV